MVCSNYLWYFWPDTLNFSLEAFYRTVFLLSLAALLLVFQGAGGEGSDGGAEERPRHPRNPPFGRSIPQYKAREH